MICNVCIVSPPNGWTIIYLNFSPIVRYLEVIFYIILRAENNPVEAYKTI